MVNSQIVTTSNEIDSLNNFNSSGGQSNKRDNLGALDIQNGKPGLQFRRNKVAGIYDKNGTEKQYASQKPTANSTSNNGRLKTINKKLITLSTKKQSASSGRYVSQPNDSITGGGADHTVENSLSGQSSNTNG